MTLQQRFARLTTDVVVRSPRLWRLFRGLLRRNFDTLAPTWDANRVTERYLLPVEAVLAAVDRVPSRVLDLGTGTGAGARLAAARWPAAEIVGVDVSPAMIAEARRLASSPRQRFEVADATALPFPDGSFDLVLQVNMIPFFDELNRVAGPSAAVAVVYTRGAETPIYVRPDRVARELRVRGFPHVAHFAAGDGVALLATRAASA